LRIGSCCLGFLVICGSARGQQTIQRSHSDPTLTRKVAAVIEITQALHPGMTRADILKDFETEGGISARQWNHYVYKQCPFIKIDVTFAIAAGEDMTKESAFDKISTVSKPYLEFSIRD
jgi:trehalose-6-phosphatase